MDSLIKTRPTAQQERRLVLLLAVMLGVFLIWAMWFPLVEVSSGQGKIIPVSREQTIQSLEGGILAEIFVSEGDLVEKDQVLARLDPTRSASSLEEAAAKYHAALAAAARLRAELEEAEAISFPQALLGDSFENLRLSETALFHARKLNRAENLAGLRAQLAFVEEELAIAERLQSTGAASRVEVIRLRREEAETALEIARLQGDARVSASEELQRVSAEAEVQRQVILGRSDLVERLVFRAPRRGIVKDIAVTTIGGVIAANGELMTLVPMDDELLVEAQISPRDIAYIHPGQSAQVKISAYDYAIFGGLTGEVVTISPDTLRDEVARDQVYYRAYIRTEADHLTNAEGTRFPIVPGMVATVDIQTGEKTVWQYLIKPFNRAREALRER